MRSEQIHLWKEDIERIEIPSELSTRVQEGFDQAQAERNVRTRKRKGWTLAVSSIAALILLSIWYGNDTFALNVKGYFTDIVNRKGAVTGTIYEQATREIEVTTSGAVSEDEQINIPLQVTFLSDQTPPYHVIEYLTFGEWKLVDSDGTVIEQTRIDFESGAVLPQDFEIAEHRYLWKEAQQFASERSFTASLMIPENIVKGGDLQLHIFSFYGHSKADAPLEIKGNWDVEIALDKRE